jgi:DNA-binding NtrC family response regulator
MGKIICLIVDDEPAIRTYLGVVLRRRGLISLEAANAAGALRVLEERGGRIDCLITDIEMPGDMDGIDLAYSVKNSFPALPVIVVSGYTDQAPPGFAFIRKPFMPAEMLQAVDQPMGL